MQYVLTSKQISGEIIDDELIVIDLDRGLYFTSKGAALPLWTSMLAGCDVDALKAELATRSDDPSQFIAAVDIWFATFVEQGILRPIEGISAPLPDGFLEGVSARELHAPTAEVHRDLADILIYDPVHDFEEIGWPKQPKA